MSRRPPRSTRTDTLFPYTTLVRSGYRPLIALQMIEVAGADRKFGRHRALVEPQLAPKPPKPCAQIEFALRRHGRTLSKIHKSRKSRRDTATFFLRPTTPLRCFIGLKIGRADLCTTVTTAHHVCRL